MVLQYEHPTPGDLDPIEIAFSFSSACRVGFNSTHRVRSEVVMTPSIEAQIKIGTAITVGLVCVVSGAAMAVACIGASRARKARLAKAGAPVAEAAAEEVSKETEAPAATAAA